MLFDGVKTMKKRYINRLGDGYRETVAEYEINGKDSRKNMREELREYQLSDYSGSYYISQRHCSNWKD